MDIAKLLARASGDHDEDEQTSRLTHAEQAEILARLQKSYATKHQFKPGDLVKQKDGLGIITILPVGAPAVVMDAREPLFNWSPEAAGSMAFGARFDLLIMLLDRRGNGREIWVDGSRFEPWTPEPRQ